MADLRAHDCDLLTVGQYLQPDAKHLPVVRYYHPDEFAEIKAIGAAPGLPPRRGRAARAQLLPRRRAGARRRRRVARCTAVNRETLGCLTTTSSLSAPGPAATSPRSAPPSSASRPRSSRRTTSAGSASTGAASPARRCSTAPRSSTSSSARREFGIGYDRPARSTSPSPSTAAATSSRSSSRGVETLLKQNKVDAHPRRGHGSRGPNTHQPSRPTARRCRRRTSSSRPAASTRSLPNVADRRRPRHHQPRGPGACARRRASIVIVGGGAIGVEFGYLYRSYGAEVTIVELLPHLLPNEDEDVSRQLERSFKRPGHRRPHRRQGRERQRS